MGNLCCPLAELFPINAIEKEHFVAFQSTFCDFQLFLNACFVQWLPRFLLFYVLEMNFRVGTLLIFKFVLTKSLPAYFLHKSLSSSSYSAIRSACSHVHHTMRMMFSFARLNKVATSRMYLYLDLYSQLIIARKRQCLLVCVYSSLSRNTEHHFFQLGFYSNNCFTSDEKLIHCVNFQPGGAMCFFLILYL